MLTISLIVRNESVFLPECLASLQALQVPVHVIDTGSTDSTIKIARDYGAEVFNYKWTNHFAEARNFGLTQINSPWILVLDADERLSQNSIEPLKRFIKEQALKPPKAYCFLAKEAGEQDEWTRALFPRDPEIRFSGRVHETLCYQGKYLDHQECPGLELIRVPINANAKRHKHTKYLPLILEELRNSLPGSPQETHYLRHLAKTYDSLQMGKKAYLVRKQLFQKFRALGVQSEKVWQDLLTQFLPQLMYYESQSEFREGVLRFCKLLFSENQTLLYFLCQDALRRKDHPGLKAYLEETKPELMEPGLQEKFNDLSKRCKD